eukprot:CAMPEP_0182426732 /NCGR_PEP_ID=MMETSP1167-20130531/13259_1 /TAXON_ID=2988 /ORGANISM="Mallomonas Sp, Strain CCMP3275" /LENGTH=88 /DNA_ID=CAMNT_0024608391 /DNA_START=69 /DNA_END=332 /DNA_ORIENTATION=-
MIKKIAGPGRKSRKRRRWIVNGKLVDAIDRPQDEHGNYIGEIYEEDYSGSDEDCYETDGDEEGNTQESLQNIPLSSVVPSESNQDNDK